MGRLTIFLQRIGKGQTMAKYRCTICGYIYDPAVGDLTQGINPETSFEDLPDSWTCQVCGAQKSEFVKEW